MKNLIVRTITGVFFVAAIVVAFMRPEAMILLFALVTGLTIWEFCGLVNDRITGVTVNRRGVFLPRHGRLLQRIGFEQRGIHPLPAHHHLSVYQ